MAITTFGNNVLSDVPSGGPIRLWDAQVEWARLQPAENTWDWSKLDAFVNAVNGRQVMLVLGHPPLWAAKGGSDGLQAAWMTPGSNRPPVSDQVWANYVVAVAERYKGRIKQYQIWNEPIDPAFYTGTFTELAQLVYRAKSLINRTDPNAKIVSPPLQPRSGWNGKGKELYQALHLKGDPFDFWSAHIYPLPGETVIAWEAQYNKAAARVWSNQAKPLWITETNMNLGGVGNPYSPATQEKIKKQIANIGNRYSIPRIYWYAFHYNNPSMLGITNT